MAAWEAPPYPIRAAGAAVPAFVGRAAETSAARESWAAVRAGGRQVIFIGGEPGAGKSRLATEIAAAAYGQGAVVLLGSCSPEPGGPYQPFAECLEHLLGGTASGALADCLPETAAELLRLTPLVWRHRPELASPGGDGGDRRRELFEAVTGLLHAAAEQRPVVCVLEDLHWASQPTLQLLGHVAERSAASRLLLLCTHRTTAPDRSDDLTYAIADLYRLDGVRRLDLAGLSTEEIAQYLAAEGGLSARRAREYATVLRDQTGGNPFFLRELWRDMTGAPTRAFGTRAPVSVRDTLQRRLARLTPAERAAVETAAVLGDGGDVRVVLRARAADSGETGGAGADAASVLAALDAAVLFGFLDGEDLARGRITFPHMLTRQAVLDLTGPSSRAALHARVGEVLQSSGSRSPAVVRQLAYHFARAAALGYGETAARYLRQAAGDAERSLAFEDAAAWYTQAADLTDGPDSDREELLFCAADSHIRAGDFASARTLYLRLTGSGESRVRLRAAIGYENAAWRPGLPGTEACALLAHALEGVPEDPDDPRHVRALASLGRATAFTGDVERSRQLADLALEHARRLGNGQLLVHALEAMMWQRAAPETVGQHLALAAELGPLAKAVQDWSALGTAAVFSSAIAYIGGDRAAWAAATADLDLAVRGTGQPFIAFMRRCGDYAHAFLDGDFGAAAQVAEDLLELGRSFGPDDTEGTYGLQMYMIRRETGALEQVRPLLGAVRQAADTWEPGLLALYTELGLAEEARDLLWQLLERVDGAAARQSPWAQWTAVLVFLTEAALALGDVPAARRLRPLLAPYSGQQLIAGQFVAVFGPADAYLAALDSLLGNGESAERLFTAALAQAAGFGALVHRASVLTAWAAHLGACGGADARAADMRVQARRLAASTGQARLLRLLDRTETPAPGSHKRDILSGAGAAGLTPREIAVLQLLADGSSNREIASRLKITENTAANHVRSILLKTGAANRTQAAMMAMSRGWVEDPAPGPAR
ncbi:MAG TPA: AAA family ATPase [Streptosporangiaceae bacterium]|nr:AAA family ATPase [Streptosporangiaceae bacterium]